MKTIFKFFAMAIAALTLCLACEKAPENTPEKPEEPVEYSIDGKQWSFTWEAMGVSAIMDFGVTEKGTFYIAVDGAAMGMTGYVPYASGKYTVVPSDGTSGKITVINPDDPTNAETVITYSDLTANSVKVTVAGLELNACEMKLVDKKVEIQFGTPEIPEEPVEYSIDGKQWSFTWAEMGISAVMDFGVTTEKTFYFAVDGAVFGMTGYVAYSGGTYTITPKDATSGTISVIDPNDPTQTENIITYSDLTATSVKVTIADLELNACEMTLVENKIEIQVGAPEIPDEPGDDEDNLSIDGKQWSFTWAAMGVSAVMDFGVTTEGAFYLAVDGAAMGMTGYVPFAGGNYKVTPTDATSGTISIVDPNDPTQTESIMTYSDLTATSVKVTLASLGLDACEMTLVENKVDIIQ